MNRTFKDFQWLYKSLNGKYPANFVGFGEQIPTLPKKKSKRTEEEVQRERLVSLQLFLSQVLQSREFRYSVDLLKFLKEGDAAFKSYSEVGSADENHGKAKLIPKPKKFIEKGVASLTIDQVENSKGFVELKMDPAIRKMSRELTKMNQSLVPYIGQAIDLSREVVGQLDKTADSMNKLGLVCANIHKCFKSVGDKFDFESLSRIETIYAELHKTFTAYSKIVQDEKENFSTNVENFFAFSACEIEGIDEVGRPHQLLTLRNEFSIEYKEKRQLLEAKKEAAHPLLDMKKWEVDQDSLPVPKTQLLADKQTALKYMFPKDTQDVKNLRDFWAYCNAQISSELREYGLMKIKRMNDQIGQYIEGFNSKINRTLTIYIDLQTRMMTV